MQYFHRPNFELLFQCFTLIVCSYALFISVIEVSIFYIFLPILVYFIISYLSLSLPEEHFIIKVLGEDRRSQLRKADLNLKNSDGLSYPSIAYQAAALDSTEDIISAIKLCWKNKCYYVHVDARITTDNVAIICSSKNIILGGENSTRLEKSIEESSYLDLSANLERTENFNGIEEPITVEDVVKLCKAVSSHLVINVIHSSYHRSVESTVDIISKLYEKYPFLLEHCLIASTNPWLLYKIRRRNKNIVVALQWRSLLDSTVTTISWLKKVSFRNSLEHWLLESGDKFVQHILQNFLYLIIGISAVILPKHLITPAIVEYWESKNVRCIAAVVNLSSEKWYFEQALGITYLTETVAVRSRSGS